VADLWLPEEDRLGLWEPLGRQLRVIGWRPGPAGVSAVELAPGFVVAVDHAAPTTLTELVLPVDGPTITTAHRRLLTSLVGEAATSSLENIIDTDRPDRPVPLRTDDRRRRWADDGTDDDDHAIRAFTRLTLAADLADAADIPDTARALATLEGAATNVAVDPVVTADRLRRVLDDVAVAVHQRPDLAGSVLDLVDALPITHRATLALDLERLRRRIHHAGHEHRTGGTAMDHLLLPMAAEEMTRRSAKVAEQERREPHRPPIQVDGDHRAWAWLDHGGNVAVTAGPSGGGAWARVFRRSDRLLLGLAPLRADLADAPGQVGVIVLVPPVTSASELIADVVADPAAPRRAPAHDQVRAAVTAGRRAARLARLGDPSADAAWSDCAERWRALGDDQRANLAVRHGQRAFDAGKQRSARRGGPPLGRLLADEVGMRS
jgi:hypothetical protein